MPTAVDADEVSPERPWPWPGEKPEEDRRWRAAGPGLVVVMDRSRVHFQSGRATLHHITPDSITFRPAPCADSAQRQRTQVGLWLSAIGPEHLDSSDGNTVYPPADGNVPCRPEPGGCIYALTPRPPAAVPCFLQRLGGRLTAYRMRICPRKARPRRRLERAMCN